MIALYETIGLRHSCYQFQPAFFGVMFRKIFNYTVFAIKIQKPVAYIGPTYVYITIRCNTELIFSSLSLNDRGVK